GRTVHDQLCSPCGSVRDAGVCHIPDAGFNLRHIDRTLIQRPNRDALSEKAARNPATNETSSSGDQCELAVSCHARSLICSLRCPTRIIQTCVAACVALALLPRIQYPRFAEKETRGLYEQLVTRGQR